MSPFIERISKRYGTLAVIGVIVIIAGVIVCVATQGFGMVSRLGTNTPSIVRWLAYVGAIVYYLGLGILSISLVCGSIFDKKLDSYVRLGMLIAIGFLLSYGVVAGNQLVYFM